MNDKDQFLTEGITYFKNMEKVVITTKLTFEDFKKVNLYLFYKSNRIRVITGICIFALISSLIIFSLNIIPFDNSSYTQFAVMLGIIVIPYFGIIIISKRNYNSNKIHRECVLYEFDHDAIFMTGESFKAELSMSTLFDLVETKNFFLVFQNPQFANVIPRRDITKDQIKHIKKMKEKAQ
jgi:hypothetical protein